MAALPPKIKKLPFGELFSVWFRYPVLYRPGFAGRYKKCYGRGFAGAAQARLFAVRPARGAGLAGQAPHGFAGASFFAL